MAMNSLQGLVDCLENGTGAVEVDEPIRGEALGCIQRMLDFVAANPAAIASGSAKDGTRSPSTPQASGLVPGIGAA
jgi:quinolinate synthase